MNDLDELIRQHITECTPAASPPMSPRLTRTLAGGDTVSTKRSTVAIGAAVAAAALVVAGVAIARDQIGETTPSGAVPASGDVPVLLTVPNTRVHMEAIVSGTLGVRDGCFTVDDAVLIAPEGSTVSPDGQSIVMPGIATVHVGDKVIGGGGEVKEAPDAVQPSDAACVGPVREGYYAILSSPLESPSPTPTSTAGLVQIPDLIGLDQQEAEQKLADVGLAIEVTLTEASVEPGLVVEQQPAPGDFVAEGTTARLIISK